MNDVKTNGVSSKYLKRLGELHILYIDFDSDKDLSFLFNSKTFLYTAYINDNNKCVKNIGILYKPFHKVIDTLNSGNKKDIIMSIFDQDSCDYVSIDKFIKMINVMMH